MNVTKSLCSSSRCSQSTIATFALQHLVKCGIYSSHNKCRVITLETLTYINNFICSCRKILLRRTHFADINLVSKNIMSANSAEEDACQSRDGIFSRLCAPFFFFLQLSSSRPPTLSTQFSRCTKKIALLSPPPTFISLSYRTVAVGNR